MNPVIDYNLFERKNILCVDMKSFYASCAAVIRGLDPLTTHLAVVADTNRSGSVVLAASPPLKKTYRIKTGSRLFEIPKDPKIIIVPAQMHLFLQISVEITRLFHKYVPKENIHTYSVDESFLDVDGVMPIFGKAEDIATLILKELEDTFGLVGSIGIGPNMLMAKLCLDLEAKEKKIARWTYEDVPKKLWPISPLSRMWGIGSRLEKRLNRMGIRTVGELAHFPLKQLEKAFGVMGNQLFFHAHGIDLSTLKDPVSQKQLSYGKSQILLRDYPDAQEVAYVILEMCEEVARRARHHHHVGRTISLGIGYSLTDGGGGFYRSITIQTPTNLTMELYEACMHLFHKFYEQKAVRQISISLSNIATDQSVQLDLFAKDKVKEKKLGYTMDAIRTKFGHDALLRAVSFTSAGTARQRSQMIGGHYA